MTSALYGSKSPLWRLCLCFYQWIQYKNVCVCLCLSGVSMWVCEMQKTNFISVWYAAMCVHGTWKPGVDDGVSCSIAFHIMFWQDLWLSLYYTDSAILTCPRDCPVSILSAMWSLAPEFWGSKSGACSHDNHQLNPRSSDTVLFSWNSPVLS